MSKREKLSKPKHSFSQNVYINIFFMALKKTGELHMGIFSGEVKKKKKDILTKKYLYLKRFFPLLFLPNYILLLLVSTV